MRGDDCCGWCHMFFCFRDIRRAIAVIGMFSFTTSVIQILIQIAVFTGINQISTAVGGSSLDIGGSDKEQVTYQIYIALAAADFMVAVFAVVLMYGNERTDEVQGRKFLMPWVILIPFYILYESGINIFYFYEQFNKQYQSGALQLGSARGFVIVPLVYWVLKDVFLFVSFIFVIGRIQYLRPHVQTQYVRSFEASCNDCSAPPPAVVIRPSSPPPVHMVDVRPPMALPAPVQVGGCNACSSCAGSRCNQCSKPTPLYGYAGAQSSSVPPPKATSGWTTSVYNRVS